MAVTPSVLIPGTDLGTAYVEYTAVATTIIDKCTLMHVSDPPTPFGVTGWIKDGSGLQKPVEMLMINGGIKLHLFPGIVGQVLKAGDKLLFEATIANAGVLRVCGRIVT